MVSGWQRVGSQHAGRCSPGPALYGYFQLLRLVVFLVAGYGAFGAYQNDESGWAVGLGVMALLFNPVFPVYLDRSTWAFIDLVCAAVLFYSPQALPDKAFSGQPRLPHYPPS